MKSKYIFFLALFMGLGLTSFAQKSGDYTLYMGPEYRDMNLTLPPDIIGYDASGYYVYQDKLPMYGGIGIISFKVSKEKTFLRKFDRDLNLALTREIALGEGREAETPELGIFTLENMYLFSSRDEKKERTVSLYYRPVSKESLDFPEEGTLVATASYDGFPRDRYVNFSVQRSRDSSKILVHYQLPNAKDAPERFAVHVFDYEMTPLWNTEFELPYADNLFIIKGFQVDNGGRVFLLGKYFPYEKAKWYDYSFKLLLLNPGAITAEEYDLGASDKPLVDLHIQMQRNQDLICVGAFMEGERKDQNVKGIYYFKLDGNTLEVESESFAYIPQDVIEELAGTDDQEKKSKSDEKAEKRALNSFDFRDVVHRSDGGALLIGEISFSVDVSYYSNGYYYYYTNYFRNDILLVDIDPQGNIDDIARIRKRQMMREGTMPLSYAMAVTGGKLRFLYNDRLENLVKEKDEKLKTYVPSNSKKAKQIITLATMNSEAEIHKEAVISTKEAEQFAVPSAGVQVSPNELILIFQKGKERRLARLNFN